MKASYCTSSLSIGFSIAFLVLLCLSFESRRRTSASIMVPDSSKSEINDRLVMLQEPSIESTISTPPLKIFVMVGQSNTQGHGYMDARDESTGKFLNGTLEWMVETMPCTYGKLKAYNNENGQASWKERDDVYIAYNRQNVANVRTEWNQHGKLVAGYGGDPGQEGHQMGPELGFGWTVGDALAHDDGPGTVNTTSAAVSSEPNILLLKVAWGGRDLAVNYRPPSAGGITGLYYEAMLADVYKALTKLPELVPGYTPDRGYSIEGFAWHQGWNDGCNVNMTAEYESNLANLIRDVRVDLGVPDLPVSIGVSGMNGWHAQDRDGRRQAIIDAQMAVANASLYPEFEGTVASVETRDFFREAKPSSPGDQIYHWNNNCESYWLIGQAMGKAMVELVRRKRARIRNSSSRISSSSTATTITTREKRNEATHPESLLRGASGIWNSTMEKRS